MSSESSTAILSVAVPSPLRRCFDYLPPVENVGAELGSLRPGVRVEVMFNRRRLIGVVMAINNHSEVAREKLKPVEAILDEQPVFSDTLLQLLSWAARYYHHSPGEALHTALPALMRKGRAPDSSADLYWRLTPEGLGLPEDAMSRAPRQAQLLNLLRDNGSMSAVQLREEGVTSAISRALRDKGLVEQFRHHPDANPGTAASTPSLRLNSDQAQVLERLDKAQGQYSCNLLEGVTGSGKTEIYLQLIEGCLKAGRQALVLIPEIGLTPQTLARFRSRFGDAVASYNSEMSDKDRLSAWEAGRSGRARVVIGTRSAIFIPLERPGVIIVDEEHDPSFKQQDGFRYHARDLAIKRAQLENVPILLGSATPSLESLHNAATGRFGHHLLPKRAGAASAPEIITLDIRRQELDNGLSEQLVKEIRTTLVARQQVLLFINRRGYAPTLICHSCGWQAHCPRCDTRLTVHQVKSSLRCHHCDHRESLPRTCPGCHSDSLLAQGVGTQRSEERLSRLFPDVPIHRVDRDAVSGRGVMETIVDQVNSGAPCILVGTQMLAKGHHFPGVALVGVLDADNGLFGADFRGAEHMGQLLIQVAGRAGRAEVPGRVIIQTHFPDHPQLRRLIDEGYISYAGDLLAERRHYRLPPHCYMAVIRAESPHVGEGESVLLNCRKALRPMQNVLNALGPLPAALSRRADYHRSVLQLFANTRADLHRGVAAAIEQMDKGPGSRRLRWAVDVDPVETL